MRTIFGSSFKHVGDVQVRHNEEILCAGQDLYVEFLTLISKLQELNVETYITIQDLYDLVGLSPYVAYSKRKIYEKYCTGVVVGAGASNDCVDIMDDKDWSLYDLNDERMFNTALGYECSTGVVNVIEDAAGNTLSTVRSEHLKQNVAIDVATLDSMELESCDLISIDVEGAAMDVLTGASKTLQKYEPDLLVSIYHNWVEYLHVIPFLYDHGYSIRAVRTSSDMAQQPHLELSVFASKRDVYLIDDQRKSCRKKI